MPLEIFRKGVPAEPPYQVTSRTVLWDGHIEHYELVVRSGSAQTSLLVGPSYRAFGMTLDLRVERYVAGLKEGLAASFVDRVAADGRRWDATEPVGRPSTRRDDLSDEASPAALPVVRDPEGAASPVI